MISGTVSMLTARNAMVYRTRTIQTAINFANHKVNPTENNEDEESTKHIVEKAEETEETAEIQTESRDNS